jgi:hypothetical protein
VQDVQRGVMGLRRLNHDEINGASIEVNRLENEADELLNRPWPPSSMGETPWR